MSDDLTRLREIAAAATPGPWWQEGSGPSLYVYGMKPGGRPNGEGIIEARYFGREGNPADAEFIATFDPPTVTALIERAERAERERDELRGRCICNTGPNTDGPDETCPVHGREYGYWVEEVVSAQQREWAIRSELAALRAAVTGLADEWDEQRSHYPTATDARAVGAEAAVKLCSQELRALLTDEGDNG